MRSTLTRYVRATTPLVHDRRRRQAPGQLPHAAAAPSGSLYGAVDILGKPTNTKGRKGIIPNYRLISKLRLNPAQARRYRLRTGAAQVRSGHRRPAGPQPRQHDRPDQRHLPHRPAPGTQSGNARRDRRAPGQARRRSNLGADARDEEGPLHRHRDGHAGRQAPINVRTSFTIRLDRAWRPSSRSDADQVRPRRGRRRRLGVATPGRIPGVARDGPGHPARRRAASRTPRRPSRRHSSGPTACAAGPEPEVTYGVVVASVKVSVLL